MLEAAGVAAEQSRRRAGGARQAGQDRPRRRGRRARVARACQRAADAASCSRAICSPPTDRRSNGEVLARLRRRHEGQRERASGGRANSKRSCALSAANSAGGRIRVDPSLARGLSYYTGSIFEIAVPDLAGSLGGGGRYDELIGMFLGQQVPACGISLGLERILVVMGERDMFPAVADRDARRRDGHHLECRCAPRMR